jgi:FixJ family two-component response regulator
MTLSARRCFPFSGQNRPQLRWRKAGSRITFWLNQGPRLPRTALIAIVDDDHSVREALTSLVRSLGYNAMAFECAEDLLKSRRRRSVSCLIADVQMPGMTGFELHNRLVTSGESIPTVLITAFPDERARERALQAGVVGYLTKPFSEDDLLACIHSTLGDPDAGRPES